MQEQERYGSWFERKQAEWEGMCHNCGACCGAGDDPCEHLKDHPKGGFICEVYQNRFGPHLTVSGDALVCVPIRKKLNHSWPGDERCPYKRLS